MSRITDWLEGASGATELREQLEATRTRLSEALITLEKLEPLAESLTARELFGENSWSLLGTQDDYRLITGAEVKLIALRARMAALLSPVIVAGLNALKLFVFGQGVTISAKDKTISQAIQDFWNDPSNMKAFTGHRARMDAVVDTHTDGNLFLRFFPQKDGSTRVRVVDFMQIEEIVCNPDDKDDVWLYKRNYVDGTGAAKSAWYPDIRYWPEKRDETYLTIPVNWETPIYQIKVNAVGKWGVCSFIAALNWAKEYERFLEHRATLYAAYAALALLVKEKISRLPALRTGLADQGKSPVKGATATLSPEGAIEAIRTRDATTPPSEGIQFLEMVMMVFAFPPHLFGKEEPGGMGERGRNKLFRLRIESEQTAWKEDLLAILDYVLLVAVMAKKIPGGSVGQVGTSRQVVFAKTVDDTINIAFPPLSDDDIAAVLDSIIGVTTLNGQKPVGHISPATFLRLVEPYISIDDIETLIAAAPETWPANASELQAFTESLREALLVPTPSTNGAGREPVH